jgi:cytoskeleton protein RodZ
MTEKGPPMNFGAYIKTARQERHLTVDQISAETKIKRSLLADLEANDLTRWPKHRIYRHGHIRSYAKKVGLNPSELIAHFDREFPDEHPVAFHSSRAAAKSESGAFFVADRKRGPTPF